MGPKPKKARGRGRPKLSVAQQSTERFALRMTPAWARWLDQLASQVGTSRSKLIADAVEEFAKRRGFGTPPKR